jgi:predicted transcriptional regulator
MDPRYHMTPDEYRERGLPDDYPMIAPTYAEAKVARLERIVIDWRLIL